MIKKLAALTLTIAMVVVNLAGCGDFNKGADTQSEDAVKSSDYADIDISKHVVVTLLTIGDGPSGTQKNYDEMMKELNKLLTEKCTAEVKI